MTVSRRPQACCGLTVAWLVGCVALAGVCLVLPANALAEGQCADLKPFMAGSSSVSPGDGCYHVGNRFEATVSTTLQGPLLWSTGFSVQMLTTATDITIRDVTFDKAILYPLGSKQALVPAILGLGANARAHLFNSQMVTACSMLSGLQSYLTTAPIPGVSVAADNSTISITEYTSPDNSTLSNVVISCDRTYTFTHASSQASNAAELQSILATYGELGYSGNITFLADITLAPVLSTWPETGYAMQDTLNIMAPYRPNTRTVLDLAGVSAFVQVPTGSIVRMYNLQVQGSCLTWVPVVKSFNISIPSTADLWPIHNPGNPGVDRVAKIFEAYNCTIPSTTLELVAGMFWLHLASTRFPMLYVNNLANLADLRSTIALPDYILKDINTTSISYSSSISASNILVNTVVTNSPPVVNNSVGFDLGSIRECDGPRSVLAPSDARLQPSPLMAPIWLAQDTASFTTAWADIPPFINFRDKLGYVGVPCMILVLRSLTASLQMSGRMLLLDRDVLMYGPDLNTAGVRIPGNPAGVSINMMGVSHALRMSDAGTGAMYVARMTFVELPALPLSYMTKTAPAGVNTTEPSYVFPFWFVKTRDLRRSPSQVYMMDVTMTLPEAEWKVFYYAALRQANWKGGSGADNQLLQGFSSFRVGSGGATTSSVHMAAVAGWGVNASNILLLPASVLSAADLPPEAGAPVDADYGGLDKTLVNGTSDGEGDKSKSDRTALIAGLSVGIGGAAVLVVVLAAFLLARRRANSNADLAKRASLEEGSDGLPSTTKPFDGRTLSSDKTTTRAANSMSTPSQQSSTNGMCRSLEAPIFSIPTDELPSSVRTLSGLERAHMERLRVARSLPPSGQHLQGAGFFRVSEPANTASMDPQLVDKVQVSSSSHDAVVPRNGSLGREQLVNAEVCDISTDTDMQAVTARLAAAASITVKAVLPRGPSVGGGSSTTPRQNSQASAILTSMADAMRAASEAQSLTGSNAPTSSGAGLGGNSSISGNMPGAAPGSSDQDVQGSVKGSGSSAPNLALSHGPHTLRLVSRAPRSRSSSRRGPTSPPRLYQPSTNSDSTGSSSRWDPKKQVAALAQDIQGEADRLQLLEPIGQGGFGAVYRGRWRGLEVAIKTVLFSEAGGLGAQQRAIMEAAVCSSVLHPNVVATYHYDIMPMGQVGSSMVGVGGLQVEDMSRGQGNVPHADWKLFLVQEYCHASLYTVLNARLMHAQGYPDMDLLLTTLLDIALGMQYLHTKNILHGDLKPENVLLKNDTSSAIGVVSKITDFGLSTRLDPNATHISNITNGTPFYAAPEVINRGQINKASDVYSYGVLMWEMFLATPPWIKTKEGYQPNTLFPKFPPTAPLPYVRLTHRCLDAQSKNRPDFPAVIAQLTAMHGAFLDGHDALVSPQQAHYQQPHTTVQRKPHAPHASGVAKPLPPVAVAISVPPSHTQALPEGKGAAEPTADMAIDIAPVDGDASAVVMLNAPTTIVAAQTAQETDTAPDSPTGGAGGLDVCLPLPVSATFGLLHGADENSAHTVKASKQQGLRSAPVRAPKT